jgi:uncharacterized RDD family membrane protein YckC
MDPRNPYTAPVEVAPEAPAWVGNPASKGQRLATFVIDQIVLRVLWVIGGAIGAVMSGGKVGVAVVAIVILLTLGYYVMLESATGKTIGKVIAGTKVVDADGRVPGAWTVVVRTLCRYIPFEPFSVLGADRGWHDRISKTYVIRTR